MLIKMLESATESQINYLLEKVRELGFQPYTNYSSNSMTIAITGNGNSDKLKTLSNELGVDMLVPTTHPFKLASRQNRSQTSVVDVRGVKIGGKEAVVIAGPCSVESREQLLETAIAVKAAGAVMLRGGAYKPRTSPYDFQGLGIEALELLKEARQITGLPIVTEVMSEYDVEIMSEYADMIQVGARNMQNFALLRRLAKLQTPILLKRGPSATIKEWLLAAEYLLAGGNEKVVLCERGIKGFDTELRNTLDLAAVAQARELSHLPILVDPSHATGKRSLVASLSKAALAMGADGVLVEVHPCPEFALSDGPQSLDFQGFADMMYQLTEPNRPVASPKTWMVEANIAQVVA
ncbi:MAG: 3-deoxy-7-phosphoheptulonate synthase [Blastocatellia bacterium]|nr:3-deoxy-7-phosphoheptulonate synthase [Blastocatellia bacterium]MBN8722323.1 3-deoxy-7-phosphoheptulonate synthase [Acidobacteriota bacterium]